MQRIFAVGRLAMPGPRIDPAEHAQPALIYPRQQLLPRAQAEVFGEIGNDQPSFAALVFAVRRIFPQAAGDGAGSVVALPPEAARRL